MVKTSELEGVVLGIIRARHPCTSYEIRRELKESPSTYWSASAGSIYPLIQRLVETGLVESTPDPADGRGRRLLSLTTHGVEALRVWTRGGSDAIVVARMFDSVRLRIFSLGALEPAERRDFVSEALAALEDCLQVARDHLESAAAGADEFDHLARIGGVYEAEARVDWMREVAATMETRDP